MQKPQEKVEILLNWITPTGESKPWEPGATLLILTVYVDTVCEGTISGLNINLQHINGQKWEAQNYPPKIKICFFLRLKTVCSLFRSYVCLAKFKFKAVWAVSYKLCYKYKLHVCIVLDLTMQLTSNSILTITVQLLIGIPPLQTKWKYWLR